MSRDLFGGCRSHRWTEVEQFHRSSATLDVPLPSGAAEPYLRTVDMHNCLKWSVAGLTFEACDFASFVLLHLPATSARPASELKVRRGDTWTSISGVLSTFTFDSAPEAVTVVTPHLVGTTLARWLERISPQRL